MKSILNMTQDLSKTMKSVISISSKCDLQFNLLYWTNKVTIENIVKVPKFLWLDLFNSLALEDKIVFPLNLDMGTGRLKSDLEGPGVTGQEKAWKSAKQLGKVVLFHLACNKADGLCARCENVWEVKRTPKERNQQWSYIGKGSENENTPTHRSHWADITP